MQYLKELARKKSDESHGESDLKLLTGVNSFVHISGVYKADSKCILRFTFFLKNVAHFSLQDLEISY